MKHGNGMLLQLALLISLSLSGGGVGGSAPTSTHLRFYMHDLVTPYPGAPATAVRVARGKTPLPKAPKRFGSSGHVGHRRPADGRARRGVPRRGPRAGVLPVRVADGAGAAAEHP